MAECAFDVAGIGNAIVDVLAQTDDAHFSRLGLTKGVMTLIGPEQAESLYAQMGPAIECSGGSAANTIAGIATLGGRTAFLGKVKNDPLGTIFRHDLQSIGVHYPTVAAESGAPTARCLVFVTPDAQRTMQTYLGASQAFGPEDIDSDVIAAAQVTYLEGYLFDPAEAQAAFHKAAQVAHAAGRKVALSLSDPFCVERHRSNFLALVADHIDILFANEAEATALFECDLDGAIRQLRDVTDLALVTRGEKGSVVIAGEEVIVQAAEPIATLVDTTGAGDLFAAGFLAGYTRGNDLGLCARLGGLCAADVISHVGARPSKDLAATVQQATLGPV